MLEGAFGDKRLERRGEQILDAMKQHQTAILNFYKTAQYEGIP